MITAADLEAIGYRRYPPGPLKPYADALYCKWINRDDARLYCLNWWLYATRPHSDKRDVSWNVEAVMYPTPNGPWITLEYHSPELVVETEAFFLRAYDVLECVPDIHNQRG